MCEMLVIERNFARRLKRHESFWFQVIQLFNKQIINRKYPQITMIRTFFASKSASELQTSESQTTPCPKSRTETTETFAEQVLFWSDIPSSSDNKFETSDEEHLDQCDVQPQLPCVPSHKR
jgi:hypothetical protein